MCLASIALGGTYQVQTPFGQVFPARVDAIDVHHVGRYHCLDQVWETAFVWVSEVQEGRRFLVSSRALRPLQD